MKAVILCAGLGTRLRPLTDKIPKPMLRVLNIPLLEYIINYLSDNGVKIFFINLFHLPDAFKNLKIPKDVTVDFYREKEIQGTLGGLLSFKNKLKDDDFLLVNGDMLFEFDVKGFVKKHKESKNVATMLLRKKDNPEFNSVFVDDFSNVVYIGKDFQHKDLYKENMFTGIQALNPDIFSRFEKKYQAPACMVKQFYTPFLQSGGRIGAFAMKDKDLWLDIGDTKSYMETNIRLFKVLTDKLTIDYYSTFVQSYWARQNDGVEEIVEDIWISKSSYVDPNATIYSPVYIGKNCSIERGVNIGPNTILGDNVTLSPGSELSNCLVLDNVVIDRDQKLDGKLITL
jgi:mannose-1-phosphate guanylyltransferase / phosphomannomutase